VNGVLPAEFAIFIHFETIGIIFLILDRIVIALLAFGAGYRNLHSHDLNLFRCCSQKPESILSTLQFFGILGQIA
jgi:hypothetical protein